MLWNFFLQIMFEANKTVEQNRDAVENRNRKSLVHDGILHWHIAII